MKSILLGFWLALFVGLGAGLSAQTIVGTSWEATVGNPPSKIYLEFDANMVMSIQPVGASSLFAIANYQTSVDTVTLNDINPTSTGCPTPGVYLYDIQNNVLTLTVISDVCADRSNFVTGGGGTWTRAAVGLDGHSLTDLIKVYPVPAAELLHVDLIEATSLEFSIIDVSGRTITQGQIDQQSNQIEVEQLPKGLYFLKIPELGQSIRFSKI